LPVLATIGCCHLKHKKSCAAVLFAKYHTTKNLKIKYIIGMIAKA